ncbi:hypothetical protein [Methylobacterium gregans]|uniref:Uncharacterized protein n=1 Tax=Methylobacterium gregans TaxID=374424 RepID=A0AA37MA60_9HYPH|nr:hypothetical protein [Methylobacterium gregans]MDQ0521949.1 hypothetical protein [Methylobacterium gregans]GJD78017.1 hypothetical protein NBEOAGPD_1229 [Methylobacterium gregans]GLS51986.1 hypothetical protein GCM10007886_01680 [Methylobacterium gregans]
MTPSLPDLLAQVAETLPDNTIGKVRPAHIRALFQAFAALIGSITPDDIGALDRDADIGPILGVGQPNGVASLDAGSKVPLAQIPVLDAAQIGTGVIDPARLPVVASGVQVLSAGDLTALTSGQKSAVTKGAVVTTTDGYRYLYTGAGDKTQAGSYIVLADITPEWLVIANKPTSFPPSAHQHTASDLSDVPADARALITAASYAAMRALLQISTADVAGLADDLADREFYGPFLGAR